MEEIEKKLNENEKNEKRLKRHIEFKNKNLKRGYDSKTIDNDIKIGSYINPCPSYEIDTKINHHSLRKNKGFEKHNITNDYNYTYNINYFGNNYGDGFLKSPQVY